MGVLGRKVAKLVIDIILHLCYNVVKENNNPHEGYRDGPGDNQEERTMSNPNSYGITNSNAPDHAFGVYDTINGEFTGTYFESREEAKSWVQTQDDKAEETGEDWTEDGIYTVLSTTDDEDEIL